MKELLLDYPKYKIYINGESHAEKTIRINSCKREPDTVKWIENFPNKSILFDIGSNTGAYSLIAASQNLLNTNKKLKKKSFNSSKISVVAIEPHPGNYISLIKNIYYNNFQNIIIPLNNAISSKNEIGFLNHWDGKPARHPYELMDPGSSGHQLNNTETENNDIFKPLATQPILSLSLDKLSELMNMVPTAVKIDVDGIEVEIINGMKNILENKKLKSILIEVNNKEDLIKDTLFKKGFKLKTISNHNNMIFER